MLTRIPRPATSFATARMSPTCACSAAAAAARPASAAQRRHPRDDDHRAAVAHDRAARACRPGTRPAPTRPSSRRTRPRRVRRPGSRASTSRRRPPARPAGRGARTTASTAAATSSSRVPSPTTVETLTSSSRETVVARPADVPVGQTTRAPSLRKSRAVARPEAAAATGDEGRPCRPAGSAGWGRARASNGTAPVGRRRGGLSAGVGYTPRRPAARPGTTAWSSARSRVRVSP